MSLFSGQDLEWVEVARYLAGEFSPEAKAEFERRVAADPDLASRLATARELWKATDGSGNGWNAAAALERVHQRGAVPILRVISPTTAREPLLRFGIAASIALVSLAAGWWLTRTAREDVALQEQAPQEMAEVATLPGQRADLLLPDGSRVTLGMASRLRYPSQYAGKSRDLYLDGEAYFQVVRDSTRPFRVHTSRGVTEDLATAFNVRAYGPGQLSVVVAEGAVVLRPESDPTEEPIRSDSLVLGAADLGRVGMDGKLSVRHNVDVESYLAWRKDRLVFRDTPLAEVLERLRAWDGIEVELADSSIKVPGFNGVFKKGESSSRILEAMAVPYNLRFEKHGELIQVYSRK